jgi:hypothetical protein
VARWKAAPLVILRIENTCISFGSRLNSAQASYQSGLPARARRSVACRSCADHPSPCLRSRAYCRSVTSATSRLRHLGQNPLPDTTCGVTLLTWRFAVGLQDSVNERNQRRDHRVRGRSACAWAGHSPVPGAPSSGEQPACALSPRTVPSPNSYSLRICSNNSTFALLSIPSLASSAGYSGRGGPFQSLRSVVPVPSGRAA